MTNKKYYILLFFILFFSFSVISQEMDSYTYKNIKKILSLNNEGKFEEAYRVNNTLLEYLKKNNGSWYSFANTYFYRGSTEIYQGKYNEAIRSTRRALQLSVKGKDSLIMATFLNQIGVCYYYLADYDSTMIYYERSFLMKKNNGSENSELAVSAYNLALAYEDLLETDKALELYKEAEKYLLFNKEDLSFLPDVYVGMASIYVTKKDIETAKRYAEKAMDVGIKSYGEFNPNITFIYILYGDIYTSEGKYKEAVEMYKKSLMIRENSYGHYHVWTCESNISLANIYTLDKQYDKAEKHLKTAIEIGEKINNNQYLSNALTSLANLYSEQKIHMDKVDGLLKKALALRKGIFGEKYDQVAETYCLLAENDLENNNKESFLSNLQKAYNSVNYDKNDVYKVISPFEAIDALALEGEFYEKEYKNDHNILHLKKKFKLIDAQIELIKYTQRNFSSDHSKISFANEYRSVFEEGLNTCWQLYNITGKYKYLQKAFELSEANRNTVLLTGLQENKFKLYANIPQELISLEKGLRKKLSKVKTDLHYEKENDDPDKVFLSELIDKRIKINKELDSIHKVFTNEYSRYKSLKFNNKTLKIEDVQKELDDKSQLIIYFLEDKNLYTFSITSNQIKFVKNSKIDSITNEIDDFKKALHNRKDITENSKNLYNILLKDQLNPDKDVLVIIPDNILSYIPFEVLKDSDDNYVLENHKVSYSGSTRLLLELKGDFFNYKLSNPWIGFSPSYRKKDRLNTTEKEVETIAKITGGIFFTGKEASKNIFLANNDRFNIIHLAMHARIDHKNPMFNKLEFSDGDLTSSEIYFSGTKANLVVLSACNTGFGKLEKGEGVISLARAFHFSGVPSVVMSLWKVPDKETKKIMVSFYEYLKEGLPKDEALQKAKIKYLETTKDEALKNPYYWSGFVLNGNTVALYHNNKKIYFLILAGLFVTALIFLIYKKHYKSV